MNIYDPHLGQLGFGLITCPTGILFLLLFGYESKPLFAEGFRLLFGLLARFVFFFSHCSSFQKGRGESFPSPKSLITCGLHNVSRTIGISIVVKNKASKLVCNECSYVGKDVN